MNSLTVSAAAHACQSTTVVDRRPDLATDVADALALLRRCVQEKGWTYDALAAAMSERTAGHFDKSQICRVLNGERPLTLVFLLALPDDVEALFESKRAEAFGMIVVPPVHGDDAVRNLVSGLVGVLGAKLGTSEPRS